MDLDVLDKDFNRIKVVDAYKSLIWTDRYDSCGDFELFTEVSGDILKYIEKDRYILAKTSESVMIVEDIEIDTDVQLGNYIKITGRSLESLLDRRIVWGLKSLSGNLQNGIKTLINESIINPSIADRKIPNFIFKTSTDPWVTSRTIDTQFTGDNLYEVICELCSLNDLGFRITLDANYNFVFELYTGTDRSYDQSENPLVIFSPKYDNLVNSNYYTSKKDYKNMTLIGGEGEGKDRIYTTYGSGKGLDRRELFTDARDIQSKDNDGNSIPQSTYLKKLQARGKEKLSECKDLVTFEGEVEPTITFVYKEDYNLGDIVQIENEYGKEGKTQIIEVVTSYDDDGFRVYPTFANMEDEDTQ